LFALLLWGVIQIPFWIARLAIGASAIWREDVRSDGSIRAQYGIRQLMAVTLAFSLVLGIGRWLIPAGAAEDLRSIRAKDWILFGTIATALAMIISLGLLGIAMKSLPVETAYAVWVGVGAAGTVALGIVLLGEPANGARLISVALIIAGIIGLKLATPA
jgi:quaternary ammonium compound-resistance protein SugE